MRVVAAGDALLSPAVRGGCSTASPPAAGERDDRARSVRRLTEREREVFELLARGLSNAEIADALTVGDATVKTHVSNVLVQLGLRDRVQAVVLAYETGLIAPGSMKGEAGGAAMRRARERADRPARRRRRGERRRRPASMATNRSSRPAS